MLQVTWRLPCLGTPFNFSEPNGLYVALLVHREWSLIAKKIEISTVVSNSTKGLSGCSWLSSAKGCDRAVPVGHVPSADFAAADLGLVGLVSWYMVDVSLLQLEGRAARIVWLQARDVSRTVAHSQLFLARADETELERQEAHSRSLWAAERYCVSRLRLVCACLSAYACGSTAHIEATSIVPVPVVWTC